VVRELNNERIDIIPFSSNPEMFVTRSLAPAKVVHIDVFEEEQAMTVAVEDEKLSLAIGKAGQNARLASKLTGWKINIMSETDYNDMKKREAEELVPVGHLEGVGDKIEERLVDADISTVQQLAKISEDQLMEIEGIGKKLAKSLSEKALAFVKELEARRAEKERLEAEEAEKAEAEMEEEPGEMSEAEEDIADDEVREDDQAEDAAEEDEEDIGPESEVDVDDAREEAAETKDK
jgi:N utilization substance protein A